MNIVLPSGLDTPAVRPTEAMALDLLRESHDFIDPISGRVLWHLTSADVEALELSFWNEDGVYVGPQEGQA